MARLKLLSVYNPKLQKGEKYGYFSAVLHLAPATLSGFNTCPKASGGCAAACLNTAGRGGMFKPGTNTNKIQEARIRKTRHFFLNRTEFMIELVKDIEILLIMAEKIGMTPVVRLNGTSDIRWELFPVHRNGETFHSIFEAFPDIQFYDYTKLPNRVRIPANYHLTFSLNESNSSDAKKMLESGMNVAVVFRGKAPKFPAKFWGKPVINGDDSDLRFLSTGTMGAVIVGLSAKGKARKDTSGFVQDVIES